MILYTLPSEYDSRVMALEVDEKPIEDYNDIGGLGKHVICFVQLMHRPLKWHYGWVYTLQAVKWCSVVTQIQELVEAIVLPMTHKDRF